MPIIFNRRNAIRSAHMILRTSQSQVHLNDLVFVGAEQTPKTIETYPNSFPHGDKRYETYLIVTQELAQGNSIETILSSHPTLENYLVRDYGTRGIVPNAAHAVHRAQDEGIIPFAYSNPNIHALNTLFSLAFWTGHVKAGEIGISKTEHTEPIIQNILGTLGFTEGTKKGGTQSYKMERNYYVLYSAPIARTFGLLGAPFGSKKSKIQDFDIPWYAHFLFGKYNCTGQTLLPEADVARFRETFLCTLLSDKTRGLRRGYSGVLVDLMATYSESLGKRLTRTVATMLEQTFPEFTIPDEDLMTVARTSRSVITYMNRIHIYVRNMDPFLAGLEEMAQQKLDRNAALHLQVRSSASNVVLHHLE